MKYPVSIRHINIDIKIEETWGYFGDDSSNLQICNSDEVPSPKYFSTCNEGNAISRFEAVFTW